jgi:hypothetical protein
VSTIPQVATTSAPTWLVVHGFAPYSCGFITDAEKVSPSNVKLTLRQPRNPCYPESTLAYEQAFAYGVLSAGHYDVQIAIRVTGAPDSLGDSLAWHNYTGSFDVQDAGPPPPPPGPIDSVSATRPNPFAGRTQFGVTVDGVTSLEVSIHDIQGRLVRRIWQGAVMPGTWSFSWDGKRDDGTRATPGLYFYRVMRPGHVTSRRVVLLGR